MAGKVIYSNNAAKRIKERYVGKGEVEWAMQNANIPHPEPTPDSVSIVCDIALGGKLKV